MYETLKTEVENSVLIITLYGSTKLNTYTNNMRRELFSVFDHAEENDDIRAVIITGNGKHFCAGADLHDEESAFNTKLKAEEFLDTGGMLALRIYELKKPIIAAINGAAIGIGITMTLPMDIRIASENAKIGFVFARRGIVQEACSSWFLPRIVGISRANEWVATGRIFSAEEAKEGGLVSRVVPPSDLLDTAKTIATEIAENTSAISVAINRQLMWKMLGENHPAEAHKIESKLIHWSVRQKDAKEGVASFFEKRNPVFSLKVSGDLPEVFKEWQNKEEGQ